MQKLVAYPCYSVDASAMIWLKDEYPEDVFASLWKFLGNLADEPRLFICEQAADECLDEPLRGFFRAHPQMIVKFADMKDYFPVFQKECFEHGMQLADPNSTKHEADPFVVALALVLEQRDPADLCKRTSAEAICSVVSYEARSGHRVKIPHVCDFYDLPCVHWTELWRREGYKG